METVGAQWRVSQRLRSVPSNFVSELSDRGRTRFGRLVSRFRGDDGIDVNVLSADERVNLRDILECGGSGVASAGLAAPTVQTGTGGVALESGETGIAQIDSCVVGVENAERLFRRLDTNGQRAVLSGDIPDETREQLLRAWEADDDLSASETARISQRLEGPDSSDVRQVIRELDTDNQRRAYRLIGDSGDDGVRLIRELDSDSVDRLFNLEDRGDWTGLDGSSFEDWDNWRSDIAGALDDSRVETDDVNQYLSNLNSIVEPNDVDVENYRALVDETAPNGNAFLNLANEADRAGAYVTGNSDFIPAGKTVDEVTVEPQFSTTNKDIDTTVQYNDGATEYIEFKRLSGNNLQNNIFDNILDDAGNADSINQKFIETGVETDDGANVGEITVDYDQYNINSNTQFEQQIIEEVELNLRNNVVDEVAVDRIRVNPVDGSSFVVDLSQVTG